MMQTKMAWRTFEAAADRLEKLVRNLAPETRVDTLRKIQVSVARGEEHRLEDTASALAEAFLADADKLSAAILAHAVNNLESARESLCAALESDTKSLVGKAVKCQTQTEAAADA